MLKKNSIALFLIGCMLYLAILACSYRNFEDPEPGSLGAEITENGARFDGTANITKGECMDPTAEVILLIGANTDSSNREKDNEVHISALTNGYPVVGTSGECEKVSTDDRHDWPADGIYYPKEERIVFSICTQNRHIARGSASLVGEGFEGEYACYDKDTEELMYSVAFSAYTRTR